MVPLVITNIQLRKSICHVQPEKLGKNKTKETPKAKEKATETRHWEELLSKKTKNFQTTKVERLSVFVIFLVRVKV